MMHGRKKGKRQTKIISIKKGSQLTGKHNRNIPRAVYLIIYSRKCFRTNLAKVVYFSFCTIGSLKMTILLIHGVGGMSSLDQEFAKKMAELGIKFCVCTFCISINVRTPGH